MHHVREGVREGEGEGEGRGRGEREGGERERERERERKGEERLKEKGDGRQASHTPALSGSDGCTLRGCHST